MTMSVAVELTQTTEASRSDVFREKSILKTFAKFLRKHLCQSLLKEKYLPLESCFQLSHGKIKTHL